jgi:hypothetical protein
LRLLRINGGTCRACGKPGWSNIVVENRPISDHRLVGIIRLSANAKVWIQNEDLHVRTCVMQGDPIGRVLASEMISDPAGKIATDKNWTCTDQFNAYISVQSDSDVGLPNDFAVFQL